MINPYRKDRYRNAIMNAALRRDQVTKWISQSGYAIPMEQLIELFEITARSVHKDAVNYAINSLAFIEGLIRANDTLQVQMNMERVGYAVNDGIRIASDVLRMIIAQELLKRANLSQAVKNQALGRLVARLLPLRDNMQRVTHVAAGSNASQTTPTREATQTKRGPTIRERAERFRATVNNSSGQNPTYF
jgi:hypothetical protein